MTPRQKEALRWLEGVGEASEFAVHRAGIQRALDRSEAQHILRVRAQHSAGQQRHVRTAVGW